MDKNKAELFRAVGETWTMVKESHLGKKLFAELDKIQDQAIKKSMRGDTPETLNVIMESRGAYATVERIRTLFKDIESEEKQAINWQAESVQTSDAVTNEE